MHSCHYTRAEVLYSVSSPSCNRPLWDRDPIQFCGVCFVPSCFDSIGFRVKPLEMFIQGCLLCTSGFSPGRKRAPSRGMFSCPPAPWAAGEMSGSSLPLGLCTGCSLCSDHCSSPTSTSSSLFSATFSESPSLTLVCGCSAPPPSRSVSARPPHAHHRK